MVEAHQKSVQKWVVLEMVFGGRVGLRPEKLLGKQIPEGGYNMRKATSQKIKEVKYLLSVLWNKKLLS